MMYPEQSDSFLIEQYKLHPELYDRCSPGFCDIPMKENLWMDILDKCHEQGHFIDFNLSNIKTRMKALRDRYFKEKRNMQEKLESDGLPSTDVPIRWTHYLSLTWLDDFKKNRSPLDETIKMSPSTPTPSTERFKPNGDTLVKIAKPTTGMPPHRKRHNDDLLLGCVRSLTRAVQQKDDEVDLFCKDMNIKLRRFNERDRDHVMKSITDLVFDKLYPKE